MPLSRAMFPPSADLQTTSVREAVSCTTQTSPPIGGIFCDAIAALLLLKDNPSLEGRLHRAPPIAVLTVNGAFLPATIAELHPLDALERALQWLRSAVPLHAASIDQQANVRPKRILVACREVL